MTIKILNTGNRYGKPWCVFLRDDESILNSAWAFFNTEAEAREFAQGFAEMLTYGILPTSESLNPNQP